MFCSQCGKEIPDDATFCNFCGAPVGTRGESATEGTDEPDTVLNVLSFLIPIVGLILYCVNINKFPKKAKTLGKWALIGFGVSLVIGIIWRAIAVASIVNY